MIILDSMRSVQSSVHVNHTDPVYPQPQGLEAAFLNSSSCELTWKHPDTSDMLEIDDDYFSYSISAVVVDTGASITEHTVNISSTSTPREVINFRQSVVACQEINFTVSLENDCRVLHKSLVLPKRE